MCTETIYKSGVVQNLEQTGADYQVMVQADKGKQDTYIAIPPSEKYTVKPV